MSCPGAFYRRPRAFSQKISPGTFPVAAVNSTQPLGQAGRLNANTVWSGSSFAVAGSEDAIRRKNEIKQTVRMDTPLLTAELGTEKDKSESMRGQTAHLLRLHKQVASDVQISVILLVESADFNSRRFRTGIW